MACMSFALPHCCTQIKYSVKSIYQIKPRIISLTKIPNLNGKLISLWYTIWSFVAVVGGVCAARWCCCILAYTNSKVYLSQAHTVTINPFVCSFVWLVAAAIYMKYVHKHDKFTLSYNTSNKMPVSQQRKRKAAEESKNTEQQTPQRDTKSAQTQGRNVHPYMHA